MLTADACLSSLAVPARQACYFAQQAAEKAIKACLLITDGDAPRSHDLDYLRNRLPPSWRIHQTHPILAALTEWIAESRYPGDWPEPTRGEAAAAVELAGSVLDSLESDWPL